MYDGKHVHVIVLASGSGARFGSGSTPKQFQMLADVPVLMHSLRVFDKMDIVDGIVLVVQPQYFEQCSAMTAQCSLSKIAVMTQGGKSRQESTFFGLRAIDAQDDDIVLVHDAARPFVCAKDVTALVSAVNTHRASVLALPVSDTIKLSDAQMRATQTVKRDNLYAAKTPQAARMADLLYAHEIARKNDFEATDDCQLMENIGIHPKIVSTKATNIKITTSTDLDFATFLLERGLVQ